jgi:hypothetical protein
MTGINRLVVERTLPWNAIYEIENWVMDIIEQMAYATSTMAKSQVT